MAMVRSSSPRVAPRKQKSLLSRITSKTFGAAILFFVIAIILILLEILLITIGWRVGGLAHSKMRVIEERQTIKNMSGTFPMRTSLIENIPQVHNAGVWVDSYTGRLSRGQNKQKMSIPIAIQVGRNVLLVLLLRLLILILHIPLLLVCAAIAISHGYVNRYHRIVGLGREQAMRFHYMIPEYKASLFLGSVLYLSIPITINPQIIIYPFLLYFTITLTVASSAFKKHL